ncbi:MAG: polysaccharide deacetylase family protein [Candidatus Moraniibacteriota bacterium]
MNVHQRIVTKKYSVIFLITLVQFLLLYVFVSSGDYLTNLSYSRIKNVYVPLVEYKIRTYLGEKKSISPVTGVAGNRAIPILTYHGVIEREDGSNIMEKKFVEQMLALKEAGYEAVSLEDFSLFIDGEKELKGKPFLLTFDDGRKDSYYPVNPVLAALNWHATIFVISEHFSENSDYYLSLRELKKMLQSERWDIQSHTKAGHGYIEVDPSGKKGNYFSNKAWLRNENRFETDEEFKNRVVNDLIGVKKDIEDNLAVKVTTLAYPFGDYGQESINYPESQEVVADQVKSIYEKSFYQVSFKKDYTYNYSLENQSLFKRISVKPDWRPENLLQILNSGEQKTIPYLDDFKDNDGWVRTNGKAELTPDGLRLATGGSTTAAIFLDGTKGWPDYAFSATIDWTKGSNISLLARYHDDANYLSCNFSNGYIRIESKINNTTTILFERPNEIALPKMGTDFGIKLNHGFIECLYGKKVLARTEFNDSTYLKFGGIGFRTWDPIKDNSAVLINKIRVGLDWDNTSGEIIQFGDNLRQKFPYLINRFDDSSNWENKWGNVVFDNGEMLLQANEETNGSLAILSGTFNEYNFNFAIEGTLVDGSSVVLLSRYIDEDNYVAMNLNEKYVRLEENINGKRHILKEIRLNNILTKEVKFSASLNIDGRTVGGYVDGKKIISAELDGKNQNTGSIGLKAWDSNKNVSSLIITSVHVEGK